MNVAKTPDGAPNDIPDRVPLAIDFYGNDFYNMGDNCVETDGSARNVRVFRNRCFNSASGALSVQPVFGGPVYFYQNLIYNAPTGSLKYIEGSSGFIDACASISPDDKYFTSPRRSPSVRTRALSGR